MRTQQANNVDADVEVIQDAGSIPAASTDNKDNNKETNMVDALEVYEVGTKVVLEEDIEAKIVQVAIHAGNWVQYECAWWNGGSRVREWFVVDDFTVAKKKNLMKIGFAGAAE